MTFAQIPAGATVFLDANTLVYHFANHPSFGAACTELLRRIEQGQLQGFLSTQVMGEIAHRLMTLEAID
jgi:predicted nucleic acid-binding protein